MENISERSRKQLSVCLLLLLAATLAINMLSGYIRHSEAGLGCADWPGCYGLVGTLALQMGETAAVVALTPSETAKRYHRAIATGLVILVIVVVAQTRKLRFSGFAQYLPYLLIGVILLLAIVGPASYLKTRPAIATVNLLGGMALLAVSWALWLAIQPTTGVNQHVSGGRVSSTLATLALAVCVVQVVLGTWVSANFAGTACTALWTCGDYENTRGASSALWYLRELSVDAGGSIVIEQAQVFMHKAHRIGAVIATAVLCWFGVQATRSGGILSSWGKYLLGLLTAQIALGLAALESGLPIILVLSHNLVASLLLLCLLRLWLLTRPNVQEVEPHG